MKLGVVILAAGQGSRMKSRLPKVLHPLAGKPLLQRVIDTAKTLNPHTIAVVYGHGGEQVRENINDSTLNWVEQQKQLGTGHAVQQAMGALSGVDRVLVLYGDVPLICADTLAEFIDTAERSALGLLTIFLSDPTGYGRIIRDCNNKITAIVEQKDATAEQLLREEINTGILIAERSNLDNWLSQLSADNAQGELYLTDIVALAVNDHVEVVASHPATEPEVQGVNDRSQLASLERVFQRQQADRLMLQGVSFADPERFDLRGDLTTGIDVSIDINVIIEGSVILGANVSIGANSVLRNVQIKNNVVIKENCVLEDAVIGDDCLIGPFARIRPGTELAGSAHIGNFVELKNAQIALGSKVNHLSYIGDSEIGSGVNIGAGTITCNYDGANKHKTRIGDNAFIGSNTALVAPINIGQGATIGAGSVIGKDAPDDMLTLSRGKQLTFKGWQRPVKTKK